MRKITKSERAVIERLIFPESFEIIQEETNMQYGELRDDLMNLVNSRLVEVVNTEANDDSKMAFYDSDNIKQFSFRATKTGLKSLNQSAA
jgi:hypothetical protein